VSEPVPVAPARIELLGVPRVGEVTEETDLGALIGELAGLADGDVVLVTSKAVSKAEGRVGLGKRTEAVTAETVRVVARRGETTIVENRLGLVMAAAGVDASNVAPGQVALLPLDPDASARSIRQRVLAAAGRNVAVLVTDTAGRPWREGQTDIAIGVAGIDPLTDLSGTEDAYGNQLAVTAPAIADELAGAANLVAGKREGRPVVVVRGLAERVLPAGQDGPGARALLRARARDMFGLGAREAVVAAVSGEQQEAFGAPADQDELIAVLSRCGWRVDPAGSDVAVSVPGDQRASARAVAFAHGWTAADAPGDRTSRLLLRLPDC
jgi:coenzyme F420-0:L-glutamate ligase/coenzyme F420-1:gamma-L-glutamate ligase